MSNKKAFSEKTGRNGYSNNPNPENDARFLLENAGQTDMYNTTYLQLLNKLTVEIGANRYLGTWNASTNTPTITSGIGERGQFYIVNVEGTTEIDGISDWKVGDWIIFDGSKWDIVDHSDSVSTVFGRIGDIVGLSGDYSADLIDNTPSGNIIATNVQDAINELDTQKEPADSTILKEIDVVDNLTSTSITAPLSANQGKQLQDTKEPVFSKNTGFNLTKSDSINEDDTNKVATAKAVHDVTNYARSDEYWISFSKGDDTTGTGSRQNPWKTLAGSGFASIATSSAHKVVYFDHAHTEDLDVTNWQNITFCGVGVKDSQQTGWYGNLIFRGSSCTRIRFKDLIGYDNGQDTYIVTFDGTAGRHYCDNYSQATGASKKAIKFQGANDRWHEFYDCFINGIVDCDSTDSSMSIKFSRQLSQDFVLNMNTPLEVKILGCQRINQINHTSGKLYLHDLDEFWRTSDNQGIISTATSASGSYLELKNCNMKNTAGSYLLINKTGDCDYSLSNVVRDVDNDTLTGTRIYAENSIDLNANYTPSNYSSASNGVSSHLEGIDNALANKLNQGETIDLDNNDIINISLEDFNIAGATPTEQEGRFFYDAITKAHSAYTNIAGTPPHRLGRTLRSYVKNDEAVTITKGQLCYISGTDGTSPLVKLSQANNLEILQRTVGMAMTDIASGGSGYLAVFDTIIGIDTSSFNLFDLIYVDPHNAGGFTNIKPIAPDYAYAIGFVSVVDAVNGVLAVRISGFNATETLTNLEGSVNGIITQTPEITFVVDGGIIYADISNQEEPTRDLPFIIDNKIYFLNTTSGSGIGGSARVQIPAGADASTLQFSNVYIYLDNDIPTLATMTATPSVPFAQLCEVAVFNAARTLSDGRPFKYRRYNNAIDYKNGVNDGSLGIINEILDAFRKKLGTNWLSGQDATTTVNNTNIKIALSQGSGKQFRDFTVPAFDGNNYVIYNNTSNTITYQNSTNLTDITQDASGNSLLSNNTYYTIRIFYLANSNGVGNSVIATRPLGSYSTSEGAIADALNYNVNVNDINIESVVYPLYDLVIGRNGSGGSTISLELLRDNRSRVPFGASGGGSSGGGVTTFTGLTDTPTQYTGQAGNSLRVNVGETGLEFIDYQGQIDGKEPAFTKNTAFNKNFGTGSGEVLEGNATFNADRITSGTLDIDRIPKAALSNLVIVADETARFALTTAQVQNGDTVKQNDTGLMYYVEDDTNLNNANGYEVYNASADWSVVTNKPQNIVDIASITAADNDIIQKKSGNFVNRTLAQLKSDLDLNNANNTSDANKPVSIATQAALDAKVDKLIDGGDVNTNIFTVNTDGTSTCNFGGKLEYKGSGLGNNNTIRLLMDAEATSGDIRNIAWEADQQGHMTMPNGAKIGVVTNDEIQYLAGVTSNIQDQIDSKDVNYVENGLVHIPAPRGGSYSNNSATVTGYIKIAIPVGGLGMMSFDVDVFDYGTNESFKSNISIYTTGSSFNAFTPCIYSAKSSNRNFTFRVYLDGGRHYIYIGESNTVWSYPKISISNLFVGYSNVNVDTWKDGWDITINNTASGTLLTTYTNNFSWGGLE